MKTKQITYIAYLILAFIVVSCTGIYNPSIERGAKFHYRPGYPQVHFNTIGFLNENNHPAISLAANIVRGSLIYKSTGDSSMAKSRLHIE